MRNVSRLALTILAAAGIAGAAEPRGSGRAPAGPPADQPGGRAIASASPAGAASARCALSHLAADKARASDCTSCHANDAHTGGSHPVGIPYGSAAAVRREMLHSEERVVARGVFLPNGRIECVTCHDPRSPWENHIALPPGAEATALVDPRKPETWGGAEGAVARGARRRAGPRPPPGSAVTATPLCLACHALD